jgi:ring-1,2-phenylacetyl-CoA epoxidase subunit PaaE
MTVIPVLIEQPRSEVNRTHARTRSIWISRTITLCVVFAAMGSLFWHPPDWWAYALDILLRGYVMFIGTVMAHEATHGHLGRSRTSNAWWGRLALLPCMVTYTKFRRTHLLHHAHTNEPQGDPDYFLATDREWEIPIRAVLMPFNWLYWLRRNDKLERNDVRDHLLNVLGIVALFGILLYFVGWKRILLGTFPANVMVSLILWYPFAVKTHEGYSTGSPESRSHNYYGLLMYWLSWGLSVHRAHHVNPGLTWIDLRRFVERAPASGWRRWLPMRDIRPDTRFAVEHPAARNA